MDVLFAIWAMMGLFSSPIFLIVFIIQAVRRRPKKLWGLLCLNGLAVFFILLTLSVTLFPTCSHEWSQATCTQPQTCQKCGDVTGDTAPHVMADWSVKTNATCENTGIEECVCSVCGTTETRSIPTVPHAPGEWLVSTPATKDASGKREKRCEVCNAITETETFDLSPEELESEYKAACQKYSYTEISRSPDAYKGQYAKFTGEVIQVQQQKRGEKINYVLRVNVTKTGTYYTYYEDTIYVVYSVSADAPRILEDDIVTMYGQLNGEKTYTTVLGSSITIPMLNAEYIDIR